MSNEAENSTTFKNLLNLKSFSFFKLQLYYLIGKLKMHTRHKFCKIRIRISLSNIYLTWSDQIRGSRSSPTFCLNHLLYFQKMINSLRKYSIYVFVYVYKAKKKYKGYIKFGQPILSPQFKILIYMFCWLFFGESIININV